MLTNVRLSKNRKFAITASPLGINGKLNLISKTGERFVVLEFENKEKNLKAKRIYFTKNGKFPGASPAKLQTMIEDNDIDWGEFVTRDNVTHFMFTNELESENEMAKVFAKNAYLHFDE
jgi:hypothetical protein